MANSVSLGEKTADAVLVEGATTLSKLLVLTDGSNPATVMLYNSADTQPSVESKIFEVVVAGADNYKFFEFSPAIECRIGLYLDISGTGASCIPFT